MRRGESGFPVTRRRFAFWVGFGLFSLGERLNAAGLDTLAAAAMRATERNGSPAPDSHDVADAVHWTAGENNKWFWFERENLKDGKWVVTGVTTPIHKETGERYAGSGYLDESLVPKDVRNGTIREKSEGQASQTFEADHGQASPTRRARHGRPPSRWLRSLHADELRIWLKTINPPPAGVEGMTYWTHLTRDHSFDEEKIAGLNESEQATLHAAAHHGY